MTDLLAEHISHLEDAEKKLTQLEIEIRKEVMQINVLMNAAISAIRNGDYDIAVDKINEARGILNG